MLSPCAFLPSQSAWDPMIDDVVSSSREQQGILQYRYLYVERRGILQNRLHAILLEAIREETP